MSDNEVAFTLSELKLDTRCTSTSPLMSYGFGAAFQCEKQKGHEGDHGCTFKWMNNSENIGRVSAEWIGSAS